MPAQLRVEIYHAGAGYALALFRRTPALRLARSAEPAEVLPYQGYVLLPRRELEVLIPAFMEALRRIGGYDFVATVWKEGEAPLEQVIPIPIPASPPKGEDKHGEDTTRPN